MALIKCSECGHDVSDKAERCPNCGCPLSLMTENSEKPQEKSPSNNTFASPQFKIRNKRPIILLAGILLIIAIAIPVFHSFLNRCDTCKGTGHIHCSTCENGKLRCINCKNGKISCDTCKGKKTIKCNDCEGSGVKKCSSCKGEGEIPTGDRKACFLCGGSGTLKVSCKNCNGKGYLSTTTIPFTKVRCNECGGTGKKDIGETCSMCKGKGAVAVTQKCETCSGSGKSQEKCNTCKGEGKNICKSCEGEGEVTCPVCNGSQSIPCPKCKGTQEIACAVCNGTGKKS